MIKFTNKQIMIMKIIRDRNPDGSYVSVYDIMDNLPYPVKRDALLHSLRIMIKEGYIDRKGKENRNGRNCTIYCLTTKSL